MKRQELERLTNEELAVVEDIIDDILQVRAAEDPVNVERRKVATAVRKGVVDWMQSKTLMEFLGKE